MAHKLLDSPNWGAEVVADGLLQSPKMGPLVVVDGVLDSHKSGAQVVAHWLFVVQGLFSADRLCHTGYL